MAQIRYVRNKFTLTDGTWTAKMHFHRDIAPLLEDTGERYYENMIQYRSPGTPYLTRFDCGISFGPSGYCISNRVDSPLLFEYIVSGTIKLHNTTLHAGDMILLDPYFPNTWSWTEDVTLIWAAWEGDIVHQILEKLKPLSTGTVYRLDTPDTLPALFHPMIENPYYDAIDAGQFIAGFTDQLLAFLPAIDNRAARPPTHPLVKRAIAEIEQNYASLTVNSLANLLYVDSCYLATLFKRQTGTTPKQYITHTRLTYAEHYLTTTDYTIQKIAELIGYTNYTNFYIAFRQRCGLSPDQYRKIHTPKRKELT